MSTLERAIEIAIEIATEAHRGQRDKAGNDYIGHPMRVMAAGTTPEEKIVGVLHDVGEDSDWTLEEVAAEGFAPEIIEALRWKEKVNGFVLIFLIAASVMWIAGRIAAAVRLHG